MGTTDQTPERHEAYLKFRQAQEALAHRKPADAERLALDAIHLDDTYIDVKLWLARAYEQYDEPRKAERLYQDVLHIDRDNDEAWVAMRRLDPAAAERLQRLHDIAPDPFVTAARAKLTEDIADIDSFTDDDADAGPAGGSFAQVGRYTDDIGGSVEDVAPEAPAPPRRTEASAELIGDIAEVRADAPAPAATGAAAEAEPVSSALWEYEQDRPMLEKLHAVERVAHLASAVRHAWTDPDTLTDVYNLCAHLDKERHASLIIAADTAGRRLQTPVPELHMVPEPCMEVIALRDKPPALATAGGIVRALQPDEQVFAVGRAMHLFKAGYLTYWQACDIILNRKTRVAGDCESTLRDALADVTNFTRERIDHDERERLRKLAHAWQLRVTLSADRAGLFACRDLQTACLTIARCTARSPEAALAMTVVGFLEKFSGTDPATLAAIPPEESPERSDRYAAYRIQMLRWWASTPQGKALLAG